MTINAKQRARCEQYLPPRHGSRPARARLPVRRGVEERLQLLGLRRGAEQSETRRQLWVGAARRRFSCAAPAWMPPTPPHSSPCSAPLPHTLRTAAASWAPPMPSAQQPPLGPPPTPPHSSPRSAPHHALRTATPARAPPHAPAQQWRLRCRITTPSREARRNTFSNY